MMDAEDLDFVCPHRICHKRQTGMAHTIANLSSDIEVLRKNPPMTIGAASVTPAYVLHPAQLAEAINLACNEVLEKAAIQALACMNPEPVFSRSVHFDPSNNMARKIAAVIRNMKRTDGDGERS